MKKIKMSKDSCANYYKKKQRKESKKESWKVSKFYWKRKKKQ